MSHSRHQAARQGVVHARRSLRGAERLEERRLLAITSYFDESDGSLHISSDDADDIVVTYFANQVRIQNTGPLTPTVYLEDVISIHVTGGQGTQLIDLSEVTPELFPAILYTTIDFATGGTSNAILSQPNWNTSDGGVGGFDSPDGRLALFDDEAQLPEASGIIQNFPRDPSRISLALSNVDVAALNSAADIWLAPDWKTRLGIDADVSPDLETWRDLINSDEFVEGVDVDRLNALAGQLLGADWMTRLEIEDLPSYLEGGAWRQLLTRQGLTEQLGAVDAQYVRQGTSQLMAARGIDLVEGAQQQLFPRYSGSAGPISLSNSGQLLGSDMSPGSDALPGSAATLQATFVAERTLGPLWHEKLSSAGLGQLVAEGRWNEVWNSTATWQLFETTRVADLLHDLVGQDWGVRLGIVSLENFLRSGQWRRLLDSPELANRLDQLLGLPESQPFATGLGGISSPVAIDAVISSGAARPLFAGSLSMSSGQPNSGGAGAMAMVSMVRTIRGSSLPDQITGTNDNDIIDGAEGADEIKGMGGDDVIDGGEGDDVDFIDGYEGEDSIDGGEGNDHLIGGSENDTIHGGVGNDLLEGAGGNDQLFGDIDSDTLDGGEGDDQLYGGAGNDTIDGAEGADSLFGGSGDDVLANGPIDRFYGGAGFDSPETRDDSEALDVEEAGSNEGGNEEGGSEQRYGETGDWSTVELGFNQTSRVHEAGASSATATWTFENLEPAAYRVFATWGAISDAATNAQYRLSDGFTFDSTVIVDQSVEPDAERMFGSPWHSLGIFTVSSPTLSIELDGNADGAVVADAIRLVRLADSSILLDPILTTTIDAGHQLVFKATASSAGVPPEELHYSLDPGAPEGATISDDGQFAWTPGATLAAGIYNIGIRVVDQSTPPRTGLAVVGIQLFDSNQAPELDQVAPQSIIAGHPLNVPLTVTDLNVPTVHFTYALLSGPATASVDQDGFHWNVAANQAPGDYTVTIRVTDDGTPALSDEMTFVVTVAAAPVANQLPQVAQLNLLNDSGISGDLITSDPRLMGTIIQADGSANGLPVDFDLNGDSIPDGTIYTDLYGDGNFVIDVASLAASEGLRTVQVRAGERSEVGLGYVFGDWRALQYTYAPDVGIADTDTRQYLPDLDAIDGYAGGSLMPPIESPSDNSVVNFAGYTSPGGDFATYALRASGVGGSPYNTTTVGDSSSHVPSVGGLPDVTTTIASTRHSIGAVDANGNWTIDETLVSSYSIVSSWIESADNVTTLTQSGYHNYTFHAEGNATSSTYTLVEEQHDTFSYSQLKTVSQMLPTGLLRTTVDDYSLDGEQGFTLSDKGSATRVAGVVVSSVQHRVYSSYSDKNFDNLHTELESLGANSRSLRSTDVGSSGWSYKSDRTVSTASGVSTVADLFSYASYYEASYDDKLAESTTTRNSSPSGYSTQTRIAQTTLQGTKSVDSGFDGVRTDQGTTPIVVTDSHSEEITDVYAHSETVGQQSHDESAAGVVIDTSGHQSISIARDRDYQNKFGGVTTTSASGLRTYLGSTSGTSTRTSTWNLSSDNSASGDDLANADAERSFSALRSSTDIGTGNYSFASSGTVAVDATGKRTVVGSSTSLEAKSGKTTATRDESSNSHTVTYTGPWTKQAVDGDSSSSSASKGTYQSTATGTAQQLPSGELTKTGKSSYQSQVDGTLEYEHTTSATIDVDEQADKLSSSSHSSSYSHVSGSGSYTGTAESASTYLNTDSNTNSTETYTESGSEDSQVSANGTSSLDDARREDYTLSSKSSDSSESTSSSSYSLESSTTRTSDATGFWESATSKERAEEGASTSHTSSDGTSSIYDAKIPGITLNSTVNTSEERDETETFTNKSNRSDTSGSEIAFSSQETFEEKIANKFQLKSADSSNSSRVDTSTVGAKTVTTNSSNDSYEGVGASVTNETSARWFGAEGEQSESYHYSTGSEEGTRHTHSDDTRDYNYANTSSSGSTIKVVEFDHSTEDRDTKVSSYQDLSAKAYTDRTSEATATSIWAETGTANWTSEATSDVARKDSNVENYSKSSNENSTSQELGHSTLNSSEQTLEATYRDRTSSSSKNTQSSDDGESMGTTKSFTHTEAEDKRTPGVTLKQTRDVTRTDYPTTNYLSKAAASTNVLTDGSRQTLQSGTKVTASRGPTEWTDVSENKVDSTTTKDSKTTTGHSESLTKATGTGRFVTQTNESWQVGGATARSANDSVRRETGNSKTDTIRSSNSETVNTALALVDDTSWTIESSTETRVGKYVDTHVNARATRHNVPLNNSSASRHSEAGTVTIKKTEDLITVIKDTTPNNNIDSFAHDWNEETGSGDYQTLTDTSIARNASRTFTSDKSKVSGPMEWTSDTEDKTDKTFAVALGITRHTVGNSTREEEGKGTFKLESESTSTASQTSTTSSEKTTRTESGTSDWSGKGDSKSTDTGTTPQGVVTKVTGTRDENWSGNENYTSTVVTTNDTNRDSKAVTTKATRYAEGQESKSSTDIAVAKTSAGVTEGTNSGTTDSTDISTVSVNYTVSTKDSSDALTGRQAITSQNEVRHESATLNHSLTQVKHTDRGLASMGLNVGGNEETTAQDKSSYVLDYDWTISKSASGTTKQGNARRDDKGNGNSTKTQVQQGGADFTEFNSKGSITTSTNTENTTKTDHDYEFSAYATLAIDDKGKETHGGISDRTDHQISTTSNMAGGSSTTFEISPNAYGGMDSKTTVKKHMEGRQGKLEVTIKSTGYINADDGSVLADDIVTKLATESDVETDYESTDGVRTYQPANMPLTNEIKFHSKNTETSQSDTRSATSSERTLADHTVITTVDELTQVYGGTTEFSTKTAVDTTVHSREVIDNPILFVDVAYRTKRELVTKFSKTSNTATSERQAESTEKIDSDEHWLDEQSAGDDTVSQKHTFNTTRTFDETSKNTYSKSWIAVSTSIVATTNDSDERSGVRQSETLADRSSESATHKVHSETTQSTTTYEVTGPGRYAHDKLNTVTVDDVNRESKLAGMILTATGESKQTVDGNHWHETLGDVYRLTDDPIHIVSSSPIVSAPPLSSTFTYDIDPSAGAPHAELILNDAWHTLEAGYDLAANVYKVLVEVAGVVGSEVASVWRDFVIMVCNPGAVASAFFADVPQSFADGRSVDSLAGAVDGAAKAIIPLPEGWELPQIGPVYGNDEAYANGRPVGTVTGAALNLVVGIASGGGSGLVQCGSMAQAGVRAWTTFETTAAMASASVNIYNGKTGLGDVFAFLPAAGFVGQKLRMLEDQCFVAGTLVLTIPFAGASEMLATGEAGEAFLASESNRATQFAFTLLVVATVTPASVAALRRAQQRRAAEARRHQANERYFAMLGETRDGRKPGVCLDSLDPAPDRSVGAERDVAAASDSAICAISDHTGVVRAGRRSRILDATNSFERRGEVDRHGQSVALADRQPVPQGCRAAVNNVCEQAAEQIAGVKSSWVQRANSAVFLSWLVIALGMLIGWSARPGNLEPSQHDEQLAHPTATAWTSTTSSAAGTFARPIERIRVGERVLADNPEFDGFAPGVIERHSAASLGEPATAESTAESHVDTTLWWVVRLKMQKSPELAGVSPAARQLDIELLRPTIWLAEAAAIPGQLIELDLPELGAAGPAEVISVEPADSPRPGRGRLVTGTFAHAATDVVDVKIAGLAAPLGCTAHHPFWSHDRQSFIPASELQVGERLSTADGGLASVISVVPRSSSERVYNLEVDGEHVYYVSADGVLVHNSCSLRRNLLGGRESSQFADFDAHHIVPVGAYTGRNKAVQDAVKGAHDVLKLNDVGLNDVTNGVFLNRRFHQKLHTNQYLLAVYGRLQGKEKAGTEAILDILRSISDELAAGTFPN